MMVILENRPAVHVIVYHEAQLAARVERHRQDVDPLVGQEPAHARQGAGAVGNSEIELGADGHSAERIRFSSLKWQGSSLKRHFSTLKQKGLKSQVT